MVAVGVGHQAVARLGIMFRIDSDVLTVSLDIDLGHCWLACISW
jgi:hypothetical protein